MTEWVFRASEWPLMDCAIERERRFVSVSFDLINGEYTRAGMGEWVSHICGDPLCSADERTSGACRYCLAGQETEWDRLSERGRAQLDGARARLGKQP